MILLENVSKTYDNGVVALHDVNLFIDKGEFVFLIGSTAAGKSTLIKLMMKEIEPSEGNIVINGVDVCSLTRKEIPYFRRTIGVVFQDYRLLPNKTAYDNVAYAMEIVGASRRAIRRQVPMVLSMVGLTHKAKMYPNELSGGEQQRVSIARAIVNNPTVLIADEPTGNLDPETSQGIMEILESINRRGTTIVMATHAKNIVDNMQRRVIRVDGGAIASDDKKGGYTHVD